MRSQNRYPFFLGVALLTVTFLAGCAAGDPMYSEPSPAGFLAGVWHGMILGFAFLVSLFNPEVGIYETHNTGAWYNFGFVLGADSFLSGSRWCAQRSSNKNDDSDESS